MTQTSFATRSFPFFCASFVFEPLNEPLELIRILLFWMSGYLFLNHIRTEVALPSAKFSILSGVETQMDHN